MANAQASAAKGKAANSLRSPEDLDNYIQVMSPVVWATLGICLALVAALLAWGIFGTVSTEITASVVFEKDSKQLFCFVTKDDSERISVGDTVYIEGVPLEVGEISHQPTTSELDQEFLKTLIGSDYLKEELLKNESLYFVEIVRPGYGAKYQEAVDLLMSTAELKANSEISEEEAKAETDAAVNTLLDAVDFSAYTFTENRILEATFVTERVAPIQLIFGQ